MGTISILTLFCFNKGVYRKDITSKNGEGLKSLVQVFVIF